MRRLVIKLDDAFSGEGNAIVSMKELLDISDEDYSDEEKKGSGVITATVASILSSGRTTKETTRFQAPGETWSSFAMRIDQVGAIAEVMLRSHLGSFRYQFLMSNQVQVNIYRVCHPSMPIATLAFRHA